MTPWDVQERSRIIQQRLMIMKEYQEARTILFYVSYGNEVATHGMIQQLLARGKRVVVPKSNTSEQTITVSELKSWADLAVGAYGILEPQEESIRKVPIDTIDLLIIPAVVFDLDGNRIGHGMGYYDKLLKLAKGKIKIGLAYEFQIMDRIPAEPHDVKVDKIITEHRVINCKL